MEKNDGKLIERSPFLTDNPPFAYVEAYKTLRTNLSFASISKQYKTMIITSANPNEGKSTVAINLSATLAESEAKVLLIDCDLRNPTLRRLLRVRPDNSDGLTNLLTGTATQEECIFTHPKLKCDVLLSGTMPPNPVELLSSSQMQSLLERLSQQYDYIICDTPPIGVVTDAAALSRFCDGIILVVRHKTSTKEQIRAAKQKLDAVQANILGTILSCYDSSEDPRVVNPYYGEYKRYGIRNSITRQKKRYD